MRYPVGSQAYKLIFEPLFNKFVNNDRGYIEIDDWFAAQDINIKTEWTYNERMATEVITAMILPDNIEERTQLILALA